MDESCSKNEKYKRIPIAVCIRYPFGKEDLRKIYKAMKNKISKNIREFLLAGILFLAFVIFTVIVMSVDVQKIGPEDSEVGLATVNRWFSESIGFNMIWYEITNLLGTVAIMVAAGFALLGLIQFIKRKSLFKVDRQILILGALYVTVVLFYIIFEYAIVNYRPVILDETLEASYPSSHTMMIICIMATAMIEFKRLFADKKALLVSSELIAFLILIVTVVGRLISGVHWFTDIIGGVLLSSALVALYIAVVKTTNREL